MEWPSRGFLIVLDDRSDSGWGSDTGEPKSSALRPLQARQKIARSPESSGISQYEQKPHCEVDSRTASLHVTVGLFLSRSEPSFAGLRRCGPLAHAKAPSDHALPSPSLAHDRKERDSGGGQGEWCGRRP